MAPFIAGRQLAFWNGHPGFLPPHGELGDSVGKEKDGQLLRDSLSHKSYTIASLGEPSLACISGTRNMPGQTGAWKRPHRILSPPPGNSPGPVGYYETSEGGGEAAGKARKECCVELSAPHNASAFLNFLYNKLTGLGGSYS